MIIEYEDSLLAEALESKDPVSVISAKHKAKSKLNYIKELQSNLDSTIDTLKLPSHIMRQVESIKKRIEDAQNIESLAELQKAIKEQDSLNSAIRFLQGKTDNNYYKTILEQGVHVVIKTGTSGGYVIGWHYNGSSLKADLGDSSKAMWTTSLTLAEDFAKCFGSGYSVKTFGQGEIQVIKSIIENDNKLTSLPSGAGSSSSSSGIGSSNHESSLKDEDLPFDLNSL